MTRATIVSTIFERKLYLAVIAIIQGAWGTWTAPQNTLNISLTIKYYFLNIYLI